MGKHQKKEHPAPTSHSQAKQGNPKPISPTRGQFVVWLLNVIVAVVVVYYLLHMVVTQKYTPIFLFNTARKHQLLQGSAIIISFLLILHTFSADWLDIFFNKTNNDLYRSHVNCVNNTILWTIVFLGAYLYGGEQAFGIDSTLVPKLFDLFLIGRIIFSLGYTVGAIIGHQSFRAVGFGIGFGCIVIMLTEVLNYSIMNHFK